MIRLLNFKTKSSFLLKVMSCALPACRRPFPGAPPPARCREPVCHSKSSTETAAGDGRDEPGPEARSSGWEGSRQRETGASPGAAAAERAACRVRAMAREGQGERRVMLPSGELDTERRVNVFGLFPTIILEGKKGKDPQRMSTGAGGISESTERSYAAKIKSLAETLYLCGLI